MISDEPRSGSTPDENFRGALAGRTVGFRSLTEGIDTTTTAGRLVFHIFAALAEFEREIIRERTTLDWPPPEPVAAKAAVARRSPRPSSPQHGSCTTSGSTR